MKEKNKEFAAKAYYELLDDEKALSYLEKRGILPASIKKFQIGYCKEGHFANRIIFPIRDIEGIEVEGFTSRLIVESNDKESRHKHSPGLKMSWFFNERAFNSTEYCIICESPIDCITLDQCGYNSVASMGANNLNKGKAEKLKPIKKIFICFDNDLNESGQKAAIRAGQLIADINPEVYNIHIPFLVGPDINAMYNKLGQKDFMKTFHDCLSQSIKLLPKPQKKKKANLKTLNKLEFSILDVVEKYVDNVQNYRPTQYKFICPFHTETEPSCYIDTSKNRFRCFGCGRNGDSIDFVRELYGKMGRSLTFTEAVDLLSSS